jgi:mannose-1-phosphate guanylyltransferase
MKAFLLAAGTGSRLRPITDHTPKCLLPIGGTTLLDLWLDALHRAEVDEVLVNIHHLADVVLAHLRARTGPPLVRTALEPELLGSAGTLRQHRDWVRDEELFLAINADNLTDCDLSELISFHRSGDVDATLTVFRTDDPSSCGIVDLDRSGLVTSFTEKPPQPTGILANAGIYAFSPSVLGWIDSTPPSDIGYDLLPRMVGRARALPLDGYFCDIGTPAAYERALRDWRPKVRS